MANPLGYALVGAGSFGNFCLQQYRTLPAIRCVGVFDFNADATRKTAGDFSIKAYDSMESLLADPDVQLLHLATPPYTHAELAATEREIAAGEKDPAPTPVFPGGPAGSEIFFLAGPANAWDERAPAERRARLSALIGLSREKSRAVEAEQRNLAMGIDALGSQAAALRAEKTAREQSAHVHANMCESGCRMHSSSS